MPWQPVNTLPAGPGATFRPVWARVTRVRRETADTWTLTLDPGGAFVFAPGQFNMLYAFGVGEVPISISGDPSASDTLTHTIRAVGPVTRALCRMKPGDLVGVRGPFGTAWPVDQGKGLDVVIVAGGIGLAPLRPALYALLRQREEYGKIVLLYGARSPQDLLYRRELERWRGRFDLVVEVTVDHADPSWRGHVGVVTRLIPEVSFDPWNTLALVCGPEVMMRFTVQALLDRRVPAENIYLSMERNMQCGVGLCGHCQFGPYFVCKHGPVFSYPQVSPFFGKREV